MGKHPGTMTIYAIWIIGTSVFKVGRTTNLPRRLRAIQVGSPYPVKVVMEVLDAPGEVEAGLHFSLKEYRLRGEWFNLPEQAVWWLVNLKWIGK